MFTNSPMKSVANCMKNIFEETKQLQYTTVTDESMFAVYRHFNLRDSHKHSEVTTL